MAEEEKKNEVESPWLPKRKKYDDPLCERCASELQAFGVTNELKLLGALTALLCLTCRRAFDLDKSVAAYCVSMQKLNARIEANVRSGNAPEAEAAVDAYAVVSAAARAFVVEWLKPVRSTP